MPKTSVLPRFPYLLACVVAALVLSGCTGGLPRFDTGTARPQTPRPVSPTPTPRPVFATPNPAAPAPDQQPTSNQDAKTVSFEDFSVHVMRSYQRVKPTFRAIERAVDSVRMGRLADAVRSAKSWAETEQRWTANHVATPCFHDYYEVWRQAIDLAHEGFATIQSGLRPLIAAKLSDGSQLLKRAGGMLTDPTLRTYNRCMLNDGQDNPTT